MESNEEKTIDQFEEVIVKEGQVEEGIEYNPVTSDDTVQDNFNTDDIEELVGEGAEIVNE